MVGFRVPGIYQWMGHEVSTHGKDAWRKASQRHLDQNGGEFDGDETHGFRIRRKKSPLKKQIQVIMVVFPENNVFPKSSKTFLQNGGL